MGNAERNATITIITELLLKNKKKPRFPSGAQKKTPERRR
jgi:hypothetical protein